MIGFTIAATALVALALLILLLPFLRGARAATTVSVQGSHLSVLRDRLKELERDHANGLIDDAQLAQSRAEVERMAATELARAPAERVDASRAHGVAVVLAVALPVFALGWYAVSTGLGERAGSAQAGVDQAPQHQDIDTLIAKLQERLKAEPDSAEGWFLLARTYHSADRYGEAVPAYEKAIRLNPADPDLLADFADALAMAQGRRLAGRPVDLLKQALAAKPDHPKALLLAGSAAFEAADFRGAAGYWERAVRVTQPGTEFGDVARNALADAQAKLGQAPAMPAAAAAGAPARTAVADKPVAGADLLEGTVRLDPAIAAKAAPDDTVFVLARAASGPPMPLAVKRLKVRDLPARFSMSDADAMLPDLSISKMPQVVVVARVSKRGEPKASSGDLEGASAPLKAPQKGMEIVISRVLP